MIRLKIALVHDWLTGYRGGERVLHHLAKRFPQADLYTLFHTPGSMPSAIEDRRIFTSPLDRMPGKIRHYRKWLPLFPLAIRQFNFEGYDLILSTSHAVAKSIRVPPGIPHLDYCFTPMRYIWDQADAYLGRGPRRWLATPMVSALRHFDVQTSSPASVTRFVASSTEVASRIRRHYGREARVIAPPVDCSWIDRAPQSSEDFYLHVAGFAPYKRDALVIDVFRQSNRRLIVVGDGPGRARLEQKATANIQFTGRISDPELAALYHGCRALIHPQHEDFGLVAVEAQAAGRPVIAFGAGGALDTIRPYRSDPEEPSARRKGSDSLSALDVHDSANTISTEDARDATGIFFHEATPDALSEAIERFEKSESLFDPERIRRWAKRFSPQRFDLAFDQEIAAVMNGSQ
jgi:glycosyltransferase involved in cell wall biosynthesis